MKSVHDRPSALGAVSDSADVAVLDDDRLTNRRYRQIQARPALLPRMLAAINCANTSFVPFQMADEMAACVPSRAVHQLTASGNCGSSTVLEKGLDDLLDRGAIWGCCRSCGMVP